MVEIKYILRTIVKILLLIIPMVAIIVCVNYNIDTSGLFQGKQDSRITASTLHDNIPVAYNPKEDEREILKRYIQQMPAPYETIVVGSSRAMQFTSSICGNEDGKLFYNAGMSGGDFYDLVNTISWLADYEKMPSNIIISLDPWLLSDDESAKNLTSDKDSANEYLSRKFGFDKEYSPNEVNYYLNALFSPDYFQGNIKSFFKSDKLTVGAIEGDIEDFAGEIKHPDGTVSYAENFINQPQNLVDQDAIFRASWPFMMCTNYPDVSSSRLEEFTTIIKFLQESGVNINFVLTPFHPVLYNRIFSNLDKEGGVYFSENAFKDLAEEYNIPVFGSFSSEKCDFENTDFYDGVHIRREAISRIYPGLSFFE